MSHTYNTSYRRGRKDQPRRGAGDADGAPITASRTLCIRPRPGRTREPADAWPPHLLGALTSTQRGSMHPRPRVFRSAPRSRASAHAFVRGLRVGRRKRRNNVALTTVDKSGPAKIFTVLKFAPAEMGPILRGVSRSCRRCATAPGTGRGTDTARPHRDTPGRRRNQRVDSELPISPHYPPNANARQKRAVPAGRVVSGDDYPRPGLAPREPPIHNVAGAPPRPARRARQGPQSQS